MIKKLSVLAGVMVNYYKHHWKIKYLSSMGKSIIYMVLERLTPDTLPLHLKVYHERNKNESSQSKFI